MNIPPASQPRRASPEPLAESAIIRRYQAVRGATEDLAAPLTNEDQMLQSMPDTSPVKWHRAHTTWFFETFILANVPGYRLFDPDYGYLFNSYYEAVGPRHPRPARGLISRPSCEDIKRYRDHVDEAMLRVLETDAPDKTMALTVLGLNHEEQHQELILTDILHAFSQNVLAPVYRPFRAAPTQTPQPLQYVEFGAGLARIGHEGTGFAFDNEGPAHDVMLPPYAIADRLVTNGEWQDFIDDGGYANPLLWLDDGWSRVRSEGWAAPLYWRKENGKWLTMSLSGLRPVDPASPVSHISFYEADAFARWAGKRLPREAEWERAAQTITHRNGNFRESGLLRPAADCGQGHMRQIFGDVWEWTQSPYSPYPGFQAASGAVGEYNGKFMINQMVLRGGSCVTPEAHIRATYRNFFHPHQRWQFSGLRLASDISSSQRSKTHTTAQNGFLQDVVSGLSQPQKRLDSKYFYDEEGSRLFDRICELEEYYPTRTEIALLQTMAPELKAEIPKGAALIELGAGSATKGLQLLERIDTLSAYIPADISGAHLENTIAKLAERFPDLRIEGIVTDLEDTLHIPAGLAGLPRLGFFPGSTIGNFTTSEAEAFLQRIRLGLGTNAQLLVGIDLIKPIETLLRAYNDGEGVTAAFNKNILVRINHELAGTFVPERFTHQAIWNAEKSRIEMHLRSTCEQIVRMGNHQFRFEQDETIHTENSHKYSVAGFLDLAKRAGWKMQKVWQSQDHAFAEILLR